MKERTKKRLKGAISIFLCLVLISNIALIGVLVDGGRYRMARAQAEAALDSASASVLSYYNQLLYDLYGLFATDSLSNDTIAQLMTDYTEKTLGITPVSDSSVRQINQTVLGALGLEQEPDTDLATFKGYDYEIDVTLGSDAVTLANTAAVEAQIIEHMKYRAPVTMFENVTDPDKSFLGKLAGLFEVADRVANAAEKANSPEEQQKEALAERAAALLAKMDTYNTDILSFTVRPDSALRNSGTEYMDPWAYVDEFDDAIDGVFEELAGGRDEEVSEADLRAAYDRKLEDLLRKLNNTAMMADGLYNLANTIRDEMETLIADYESYMAALQAKIDAEPNNENLKTLYLPEIELAQGTCGELVKNIDLILMSRQYTKNMADGMRSLKDNNGQPSEYQAIFEFMGSQVIDFRMTGYEINENGDVAAQKAEQIRAGYTRYLRGNIEKQVQPYGMGAMQLLSEFETNLSVLNGYAKDFKTAEQVTIQTEDITVQEKEKEEEKEELREFVAKDLKVSYTTTNTDKTDWYPELEGDVTDSDIGPILEGGLNLIKEIEKVLEDSRDSLYINEYAVAYFPNYVQHYRAADKDFGKNAENAYLIADDSYYRNFNASQAELEYIVTGNTDINTSLANISARLLGIRLAFNAAAIFTDAAKVSQANTLAATISGPFAPLVATALLIAWALAESALDVDRLLNGEEVELFKQGKSWKISVEGMLEELVTKATEYVTEEVAENINDKINEVAATVEMQTNKAIYEGFKAIKSGADSGISAAEKNLNQWTADLGEVTGTGGAIGTVTGTITNETRNQINGLVDDTQDKLIAELNQQIRSASTKLQEKVNGLSEDIKNKITTYAAEAMEKYLPKGTPTSTGDDVDEYSITLNYMDYMRIFLLFMGNGTKVQRIQSLVQANLRYGGQKNFSMGGSYVSVSAQLDGSIGYMMIGSAFLPAALKQDGRLPFSVSSNLSY